jgi:hypothetical protein
MKTIFKIIILSGFIFGLQTNIFGQCKSFTKQVCKPKLSPYIYNGQVNSAILKEGDVAELMMTFYSGQDYRIVVCGEETLKNITFILKDMNGNEIFTNADHNMTDHWDFHAKVTQQLTVEVSIPVLDNNTDDSGCVSILVGFKDKK